MAPRRGSNGEGEKGKPEMGRFRSASTWTPPQGGAIRCKSNHLWRNVAAGKCRWVRDLLPRSRSMTPEKQGRSPTMQEKLAR